MSTATTTTAENAGLPAMLDTKDVAEMFKRCNLAVYAEARRIYYRERVVPNLTARANKFRPFRGEDTGRRPGSSYISI